MISEHFFLFSPAKAEGGEGGQASASRWTSLLHPPDGGRQPGSGAHRGGGCHIGGKPGKSSLESGVLQKL